MRVILQTCQVHASVGAVRRELGLTFDPKQVMGRREQMIPRWNKSMQSQETWIPAKGQEDSIGMVPVMTKQEDKRQDYKLINALDGKMTIIAGTYPHLRDGEPICDSSSPGSWTVSPQPFGKNGSIMNKSLIWRQKWPIRPSEQQQPIEKSFSAPLTAVNNWEGILAIPDDKRNWRATFETQIRRIFFPCPHPSHSTP
jgi:hypothetical protein